MKSLALKEIINPSWELSHIHTCVYYCKIFVIISFKLPKYLKAAVISFNVCHSFQWVCLPILSFCVSVTCSHCSLKSSSMEGVSDQLVVCTTGQSKDSLTAIRTTLLLYSFKGLVLFSNTQHIKELAQWCTITISVPRYLGLLIKAYLVYKAYSNKPYTYINPADWHVFLYIYS